MSLLSSAGKLSTQWAQWECKAQCLRKRKYIEKEHLLENVLQKEIEIRILWMHLKSLAILFTHVNRLDVLLEIVPNSTKILRRDSQLNTRRDTRDCRRHQRSCNSNDQQHLVCRYHYHICLRETIMIALALKKAQRTPKCNALMQRRHSDSRWS